jgi:hypothetical protein
MIREAAHPGRRTFREPATAIAWLTEVLGPEELVALRAFLGP